MPDLQLQPLIQERKFLEVEFIPGGRDHMIGAQHLRPPVPLGKLQLDAPIPRFSPAQLMTSENGHLTQDPIFQPPASCGTQRYLNARKSNLRW
jgi:hypothetical protein